MAAIPDRRGVEVPVDVDLGAPDETGVDIAALQHPHEVDRPRAPHGAGNVGIVAHRVEELGGRLVAHDAELEETDRVRRVRALRDDEGDERKAHPDEHALAIADLARGLRHHDLARRQTAHKRTSTKIQSGP